MQDFEKLGSFYLGRSYDLAQQKPLESLLLYDSKDLVTHAVCLGMTGSGKTGLCLTLLEEAGIDGIPALIIDPKGDLTNLLLTFPQLRAEDFGPWVNEEDAAKKGLTPQAYAEQQAELWKKGLAEWGQDGERIKRLRDRADIAIYTPGSNAGLPVSILKSFDAPDTAILEDDELLRDRIRTTASSLLGLLGIEADPIQSREHILISTILNSAWRQRQNLDLAALIQQTQSPPISRIGVLDMDSFYPAKDRFTLAMQMNNLLAAPGFDAWMEGEPLDVGAMLYTAQGKPRLSILSIAHLNDAERMFFVSLVLNQTLGWMRGQPGTSSLRAILYMDEIFGYFPPVSNPPSKAPLLTLLKQARAFGLGVVLATQNPVDLDYKGLANIGTWFIGRLQTERDKARVLEGLEGAATTQGARFDRQAMDQILGSLGNRIFLMNNVHEDSPEVFQVRWALSYLRGPLTRNQIKKLMDARKSRAAPAAAPISPATVAPAAQFAVANRTADLASPVAPGHSASAATTPATAPSGSRPVLPPEIVQCFVPIRAAQPTASRLVYLPMVFGYARITFTDAKTALDTETTASFLAEVGDMPVVLDWQAARPADFTDSDLAQSPADAALFATLPAAAGKPKNYDAWKKSFADFLFRNQKLELFQSTGLGERSKPGESERDFRVRLGQLAREERDRVADKLRQKYAPKIGALQDRIRRAEQAVEREAEQAKQQKFQTVISVGATLLGAFIGRKAMSLSSVGKATTAMRGASRSMKESQDVTRASESVQALQQKLADLEAQFQAETQTIESRIDPLTERLETVTLKPKKANVSVLLLTLAWTPFWQQPGGELAPAWE